MDLTCITPAPTKTPDSENDTPPHITAQPLKNLSFINGNRHHNHLQQPSCAAVTYKECLRNHAASIGGHAVDGCGEFMPSRDDQRLAQDFKCAACGCHRNFHRREQAEDHFSPPHFINFRHHILPPIRQFSPSPSPSPPSQPQPVTPKGESLSGRKRFRTKFTQEQKDRMCSFSEKLGWKMQKGDEAMVENFCNEVGVSKSVLRVWMHNNKNTFGKKELQNGNNSKNNNNNNGFNINVTSSTEDHDNNNDSSNCGLQLHISTNGSSSSS